MARSVVNAYEHGARQPSVAALARLAAAGGFELALAPRHEPPVDPARAGRILEQVLGLAEQLPYQAGPKAEVAPLPSVARPAGGR